MSPLEGRPREDEASGFFLRLAVLFLVITLVAYLFGYLIGHDNGYREGVKHGLREKVLESVVTTTTQGNLIPPIAEVDPTHTGQHGKPVCGDFNGDGVPDSPSGDPPPGKDRMNPTDCYPYGTGR